MDVLAAPLTRTHRPQAYQNDCAAFHYSSAHASRAAGTAARFQSRARRILKNAKRDAVIGADAKLGRAGAGSSAPKRHDRALPPRPLETTPARQKTEQH